MLRLIFLAIPAGCILLCAGLAHAEGMIDINPSVATNITYDDNVFRFSSPTQAQQAFGLSATGDTVKRLDVGLDTNVRLSRQLIRLSAFLSESRYNRFDLLDNTAKSALLAWDWQLGNNFFGVLSASKNESIAGFNEIRNPVKNLRTVERQSASVNWRFHPDWMAYASRDHIQTENELLSFESLNREDEITESGLRYRNPLGTQLAISYRIIDSQYPNRSGFAAALFGDESVQSALTLEAAWLPSAKTRISTRLSRVNIDYENSLRGEFSGFNQRADIGHALTRKVTLNATVYKEVSPIDDILSTFVEATGASFNTNWAATSKVSMHAGVSYEDREFLGSTGFFNSGSFTAVDNRSDRSKTANAGLMYAPTLHSTLQLQYQTENRDSTLNSQSYRFNTLSFVAKYNF